MVIRLLAWEEDHSDCLPDSSPQAHPIYQDNQGTKFALEPLWVQQCNHTIVRVEEGILMPTLFSTLIPLFRALHCHRHPVPHHRIHHHI